MPGDAQATDCGDVADPETAAPDYPEPAAVAADPDTAPVMYWTKSQVGPQPWLDGQHVMVSAGVAWRNGSPGSFTITVPENPDTLFVDSGGFQATVYFGDEYPYTPTELFEWAEEIDADYVAGMDWACESGSALADTYDDVAPSDIPPVADRIEWTVNQQAAQKQVYDDGDWSFDLVPVVQGLEPDDYRYCARRLRETSIAAEYMGIGTVCKRASADGILEVLDVVEDELPATEWHLFGATKSVWEDRRFWDRFASADTHAWAMKNDDGTWTANEDDKRRAWESYSEDIEELRARMVEQDSLYTFGDDRSQFAALLDAGAGCVECVCGTTIPAYGTDIEPGCRFCAQTKLNRDIRNLHEVDTARHPGEATAETTEQTTL